MIGYRLSQTLNSLSKEKSNDEYSFNTYKYKAKSKGSDKGFWSASDIIELNRKAALKRVLTGEDKPKSIGDRNKKQRVKLDLSDALEGFSRAKFNKTLDRQKGIQV